MALKARSTKPTYPVLPKVAQRQRLLFRLRSVWPQALILVLVGTTIPGGWIHGPLLTDALVVNSI